MTPTDCSDSGWCHECWVYPLVVWKLDRLGRDLRHLVNTVHDLSSRGIGLKVLAGQGANIDTATAGGKLVFGIFAALAEFERELIRERTKAGLAAARARGRKGGRKLALSKVQVRLAQAAMAKTGNQRCCSMQRTADNACHPVSLCRAERGTTGAWAPSSRRRLLTRFSVPLLPKPQGE